MAGAITFRRPADAAPRSERIATAPASPPATGQQSPLSFQSNYDKDVKWRASRGRPSSYVGRHRLLTGSPSFDEVTRGLPFGLTVLEGSPGSGKTTLLHHLAKTLADQGKKIGYIFCESVEDAPDDPRVWAFDYTRYLPMWEKAVDQAKCAISVHGLDILVIDSVTDFLSQTRKAVEEADVGAGLKMLSKAGEGSTSILGVSQIRGEGKWVRPAGGQVVRHASVLHLLFDVVPIDSGFDARHYDAAEGDVVWTFRVGKDKQRMADQTSVFRVLYENEAPVMRRIKFIYSRGGTSK